MCCISISICCNSNLFYVSHFNFYAFFLKSILHKMNSKMIESEMVMLIEREKTDITDADVLWVGCCGLVQAAAEALVLEMKRES
jgi:hypothetical protein